MAAPKGRENRFDQFPKGLLTPRDERTVKGATVGISLASLTTGTVRITDILQPELGEFSQIVEIA